MAEIIETVCFSEVFEFTTSGSTVATTTPTTTTITPTNTPSISSPQLVCPTAEIDDANFLVEWRDSNPPARRNYDIFINGIDTGPSVSNVPSTQKNIRSYMQGLTGTFDLELLYFDNGDTTNINSAGNCTVSYSFTDRGLNDPTGRDAFWSSKGCLLYTSPSPRDATLSRMPSSA